VFQTVDFRGIYVPNNLDFPMGRVQERIPRGLQRSSHGLERLIKSTTGIIHEPMIDGFDLNIVTRVN
jgi:hypothetical protein